MKPVMFKTVWFRSPDGEWDYYYRCIWTDGTVTDEVSLPWAEL